MNARASQTRSHRIACIPGDGIGVDVVEAGLGVLEVAASSHGFALDVTRLPWGSDYHEETGEMMPPDALDTLRGFDAIYFGAVGSAKVPDHEALWGLILPIRQELDLYVSLRPVQLLPGVDAPLKRKGPEDVDIICVRENTEGEYAGAGGRVHRGLSHEVAVQADIFTRTGVERIARYAFELAQKRRGKLTSITKSNAGLYAFTFWDDVVAAVAEDFPEVEVESVLVDAAAAYFISRPEAFDVVVGSNLFMDILTDLGAVIQGGMGLAASANLNPEGDAPAMFEPVHGSAPDIAGMGIANPIGAVWAGALMLEHLGEHTAASGVMAGVKDVLCEGEVRTPDLGGSSTTVDMAAALTAAVHGQRAKV